MAKVSHHNGELKSVKSTSRNLSSNAASKPEFKKYLKDPNIHRKGAHPENLKLR